MRQRLHVLNKEPNQGTCPLSRVTSTGRLQFVAQVMHDGTQRVSILTLVTHSACATARLKELTANEHQPGRRQITSMHLQKNGVPAPNLPMACPSELVTLGFIGIQPAAPQTSAESRIAQMQTSIGLGFGVSNTLKPFNRQLRLSPVDWASNHNIVPPSKCLSPYV